MGESRKLTLIFILLLFTLVSSQTKYNLKKTSTLNSYNHIAINNCLMNVTNTMTGCIENDKYAAGLLWPLGEQATQSIVYADGLVWGGKIDDKIVVGGSTYKPTLNPGKILANGEKDDTSLSKYRVYRINKEWKQLPSNSTREAFAQDYYEWPVQDGAPWIDVNKDGKYNATDDKPDFLGDEVLWYVSNDLVDSAYSFVGSDPIGLEIQTTIFAYNKENYFDDIIYKKYRVINKSQKQIKNLYFGFYSDPDIGTATDDYAGCDTNLSLAYAYNSKAHDSYYYYPPAVGYRILQVGENKNPMTSFVSYYNTSEYEEPTTAEQYYNVLQGKSRSGTDHRDPISGRVTKFMLPGDPFFQTGWYEGAGWPKGQSAGDRRFLASSGTYNMNPNDTIDIVVAVIVGFENYNDSNNNNLLSVYDMKEKAFYAKKMYDMNFETMQTIPSPETHCYSMDKAVKLWWDSDVEAYNVTDPFLDKNADDTTYTFEGYRFWQFSDSTGTDSVLLGTFDLVDDLTTIYDYENYNGVRTRLPIIVGTNSGLEREMTITLDAFSNYQPLNNYSPYYFGVTAYAYNDESTPTYIESAAKIVKVIPGQERIDVTYPYTDTDALVPTQVVGNSDSRIKFNVVDPAALTGDTYQVIFTTTNDGLSYSLFNKTIGDTLLSNQNDYTSSLSNKPIIDGFILTVEDVAKDSIKAGNAKYRVKSVLEIKGKNGVPLPEPIDVIKNLSSTNNWQIKVKGTYKRLNFQTNANEEGLGYDDYEIRFDRYSRYYYTGYAKSFFPLLKSDPIAADSIPFEAWCIGRDTVTSEDDYQLAVKVLDLDRNDLNRAISDSVWTQFDNGDWEEIFAFKSSFDPADPPANSGINKYPDFKFGSLSISGEIPETGTVIRIITYKPLTDGDVFEATLKSANTNDIESAKTNIDKISVFPNPYFGGNGINNEEQNFIRFTTLPRKVTIRIYSLAGAFIRKLTKDDYSSYLDWDLQNENGIRVSSGMYIAHLDMPEIGTKIMKIAIIQEKKYLQLN